jgi:peptidoglycan hydrolase CwlO-like protein
LLSEGSSMLSKISIVGLCCTAIVGLIGTSVKADEATVQTVNQEAIINGDNNRVIQVTNQVNVDRSNQLGHRLKEWKNRENKGVVQDAYQRALVNGQDNRVRQDTAQNNHGN